MQLRLESADGMLVNDYRICDGSVQVRTLNGRGQPVIGALGKWRPVRPEDIALHHALGTVVSEWLRVRVGPKRSALVKS
jgi:hypothetical protein